MKHHSPHTFQPLNYSTDLTSTYIHTNLSFNINLEFAKKNVAVVTTFATYL